MNASLPSARVRSLQELAMSHQKVSCLFMQRATAPNAMLIGPLTRFATDGTFNQGAHPAHLVR